MLVAVYGTLKQGHKNNLQYLDGLRPLHSLFVEIPYRMYEGEAYPMIVYSRDSHSIFVEVFEVDADKLEELDRLEAPYNFHRENIFLAELDREAAIYVFDEPDPPADFTAVPSGKWE
jgi:gamma-glutamylcyclotransferase (GGCT)/AIG2-like uncharacterized protein YtfP